MNLLVTTEYRFKQLPDGSIWVPNTYGYSYWNRYLAVFESVTVMARVEKVESVSSNWLRSDGSSVSFVALPYYIGLKGMLKSFLKTREILAKQIRQADALVLRVPSQICLQARITGLLRTSRYAVEVVGDPYDVFCSGIAGNIPDKIMMHVSTWDLRNTIKNAVAVSYVTQRYLQKRFPPAEDIVTAQYSSIDLLKEDYVNVARNYTTAGRKILFVGSLSQMYKGADTLVEAVSHLIEKGMDLQVEFVGSGRFLNQIKLQVKQAGCEKQFNFHNEVSKTRVLELMDESDIFVMPSLTEGLPRALIEAMARGLPCIATSVGGIPELLDEAYMVNKRDWQQLALRIEKILGSATELNNASRRNLEVATQYRFDSLMAIRQKFYGSYRNEIEPEYIFT